MHPRFRHLNLGAAFLLAVLVAPAHDARAVDAASRSPWRDSHFNVQVGPRPYYLVDQLPPGPLKQRLEACSERPLYPSKFSIGHRGAAMQFPEHTKESYEAAARMGAGIVECDVTFTKDRELVCRHDQCDLHQTTNILLIEDLAAKCSEPFKPAANGKPASARCCTSDITLAEFKRLQGKMDGFNPNATNAADFLKGTPSFRTDAYAATGTLMTHKESIALFKKLGVDMTPELKAATGVELPYNGFTQANYAQKMIDEYKQAGVSPHRVFAQSFNIDDIYYWIRREPAFGRQAVALADLNDDAQVNKAIAELPGMRAKGVNIVAPPTWALVTLDSQKRIVPSEYAILAKHLGFDIITWTLERSGTLTDGGGFYFQSISPVVHGPGDYYVLLDVLTRKVGIRGIFSDWPGTVTYYANCFGLK